MATGAERNTRERIIEVAALSFAACGYHGTRLHHIADRVGVQKASLFHYFPSKERLYSAVLEHAFGETERTIRTILEGGSSPLEKIPALVNAYVELVAAQPQRAKILLRHSLGDAPVTARMPDSQGLLGLVVKCVADGQRAKLFAPIDPLALVLGVVGMVAFFFTSAPVLAPAWYAEPSVEQVRRHVTDIVQRCLAISGGANVTRPHQAVA